MENLIKVTEDWQAEPVFQGLANERQNKKHLYWNRTCSIFKTIYKSDLSLVCRIIRRTLVSTLRFLINRSLVRRSGDRNRSFNLHPNNELIFAMKCDKKIIISNSIETFKTRFWHSIEKSNSINWQTENNSSANDSI